jgi:hypothetical protein
MDPRIEMLIEQLERGDLTADAFAARLREVVDEVGDAARASGDDDDVKLERIGSAARKAVAL